MYDAINRKNDITLTPKELKALDSDTRIEILKMLKDRNHTLSEMSKKLSITPPSVKQHLGILVDTDIIEQLDEGRKWKYYSLTRKGRGIAAGEQASSHVFIVLGAGSICLLLSFGLLISNFIAAGLIPGMTFTGAQPPTVLQATPESLQALEGSAATSATQGTAADLPKDSGSSTVNGTSPGPPAGNTALVPLAAGTGQASIWNITCIHGTPTLVALIVVFAIVVGYAGGEWRRKRKIFLPKRK